MESPSVATPASTDPDNRTVTSHIVQSFTFRAQVPTSQYVCSRDVQARHPYFVQCLTPGGAGGRFRDVDSKAQGESIWTKREVEFASCGAGKA